MDYQRRQFLVRFSIIAGIGATITYLPSFLIPTTSYHPAGYEKFLKISHWLTGNNSLSPELTQLFFDTLSKHENPAFSLMLDNLHTQEEVKHALREQNNYGEMITKVAHMWYFGTINNKTISMQAYRQGLVWPAFNMLPPGFTDGSL